MRKYISASLVAFAFLAIASGAVMPMPPAYAADRLQPIDVMKVDVRQIATGYRATKIVGSSVINNAQDTIGTVDDLIISAAADKALYAIISVGGFLGMGKHLIAVPYSSLSMGRDKVIFPAGTQEYLKAIPEFKYEG